MEITMNSKNKPWHLHLLLSAMITAIWGIWFDYSYWQWIASLAVSALASVAGAQLFRSHYLVRGIRL